MNQERFPGSIEPNFNQGRNTFPTPLQNGVSLNNGTSPMIPTLSQPGALTYPVVGTKRQAELATSPPLGDRRTSVITQPIPKKVKLEHPATQAVNGVIFPSMSTSETTTNSLGFINRITQPISSSVTSIQPTLSTIYRPPSYNTSMTQSIILPSRGLAQVQSLMLPNQGKTSATALADDDKIDYTQLNDAMAFTGVDLKEESEFLQKETLHIPGTAAVIDVDRSKAQKFMNLAVLKARFNAIVAKHHLSVHPDVYEYLALAAEERTRSLIEQMNMVKNHRTRSNHLHEPPLDANNKPLYNEIINQDVKSQLFAIENAEREQERKRKELLAKKNKPDEKAEAKIKEVSKQNPPAKKLKVKKPIVPKEPPQPKKVIAESKPTSTNETALKAAGGSTKSWMLMTSTETTISTTSSTNNNLQSSTTGGGTSKTGRSRTRSTGSRGKPALAEISTASISGSAATDIMKPENMSNTLLPPAHPVTQDNMITVLDALKVLENDPYGGGSGLNQKIIMKGYAKYLR
ncbi:hypothetical protein G9A89_022103 [Geosiphon pyriformis]|nr:hypothetical protein G9A89_022103 [Geosiphon pyriformis]